MKNSNTIDQALQTLAEAIKSNTEQVAQVADAPIKFTGKVYGKGLLWAGTGHTKQFVLSDAPERFFSSESIDLSRDKSYFINKTEVLNIKELGPSVVKSNLREVGRLQGLVVDGALSVNSYLYYDNMSDRLGLGTDEPNAALSIAENGVEVIVGSEDFNKGVIGTFASHTLSLKTDNKDRLTISPSGDINLGGVDQGTIKVAINGKLAVGINNADPNVDLHVKGSIRYDNHVHMYSSQPPQGGVWNQGDIVWNTDPAPRKHVGWVCTKTGSPGIWNVFGEIK